jgi:hypothetical protein
VDVFAPEQIIDYVEKRLPSHHQVKMSFHDLNAQVTVRKLVIGPHKAQQEVCTELGAVGSDYTQVYQGQIDYIKHADSWVSKGDMRMAKRLNHAALSTVRSINVCMWKNDEAALYEWVTLGRTGHIMARNATLLQGNVGPAVSAPIGCSGTLRGSTKSN